MCKLTWPVTHLHAVQVALVVALLGLGLGLVLGLGGLAVLGAVTLGAAGAAIAAGGHQLTTAHTSGRPAMQQHIICYGNSATRSARTLQHPVQVGRNA